MKRINLADRSSLWRHIRINRIVITTAVSLMIGYYMAATQLSLFTVMKQLEPDSIMSTVLLPGTDRKGEFYQAQAGQDKWIFETLMGSNVEAMRDSGGIFI